VNNFPSFTGPGFVCWIAFQVERRMVVLIYHRCFCIVVVTGRVVRLFPIALADIYVLPNIIAEISFPVL